MSHRTIASAGYLGRTVSHSASKQANRSSQAPVAVFEDWSYAALVREAGTQRSRAMMFGAEAAGSNARSGNK
jgi:hypothetical protein